MMFCKETEFQDSSIGKIPSEWQTSRLGQVCDRRNELIQPSGDGKTRFVGLEHIGSGELKIKASGYDSNLSSSKYKFHSGDILYGKLRPYLDKAAMMEIGGICSTDLIVLVAKESAILSGFLLHVIHSKAFIKYAIASTSGTNHPRTSWDAISRFEFGIPSLPEQGAVVGVLGVVDSAIELADRIVLKTERSRRVMLQRLMAKGIGKRVLRKTECGEMPENWKVEQLSNHCESSAYGPRFGAELYSKEGQIGTIRTTDFTDEGEIDFSTVPMADLSEEEISGHILKAGDLLISRSGTVGLSVVFPNHDGVYIPGAYLIRFRMKETVFPKWLKYFFDSRVGTNSLMQLSEGGVQKNLKGSSILRLKLPLPPVDEQKQIAAIISAFDDKIGLERKAKEKMIKIKLGLMDLLLTGKVRIKVG